MVTNRQLTFDDYLRIFRRRIWVIIIPTILAPIIAYLISLTLHDRFTSQTLVMIEQPKVPENLVKPVVMDDLIQRLQTMQEQILSRTRLQPIIDRFGLYQDEGMSERLLDRLTGKKPGKASVEELIEMMRKDIKIRTVRADRGVPGFYVNFTSDNPRMAQQVCSQITSMFIQENLNLREQHAEGTTDFLRAQLEQAKVKLDNEDKQLAVFKQRYVGQLPGQEQANMNILMGLSTQLEAVNQAANRAQQDKAFIEALLAQQVADWKARPAEQKVSELAKTGDDRVAKLQAALVEAEAHYTSEHPDVVKLKKELAALQGKLKSDSAVENGSDTKSHPNNEPANIRQMRLNILQLDRTIQEKVKEQERLKAEIRKFEARVQLSPVVEEQYKGLTRGYQTALALYNDLLAKKTQSEMATDLERKQQGEQFRIMDPPNLPERPTFPNRPIITLAGLAVGIGLGLAMAFLLETLKRVIRTEEDVALYLELPTLAMVPVVGGKTEAKLKTKKKAGAARALPVHGQR